MEKDLIIIAQTPLDRRPPQIPAKNNSPTSYDQKDISKAVIQISDACLQITNHFVLRTIKNDLWIKSMVSTFPRLIWGLDLVALNKKETPICLENNVARERLMIKTMTRESKCSYL